MTSRSLNPHEIDLGVDGQGNSLRGFRQIGIDLNQFSVFFKAAFQIADDLGVDNTGIYYLVKRGPQQFVLAGWLNGQIVKSEPTSELSDATAQRFIQAVHDVQNEERRKKGVSE